jgi:hypothetical protein
MRLSALTVLVLVTACGGSGGPAMQPPATPVISELRADLSVYVSSTLNYVQRSSEGYVIPTSAELTAFDALATTLLNRQLESARAAAGNIDFELVRFVDTGANNNQLYCLQELTVRGRGFFCIDVDSPALHHISVPHPLYDSNTNSASVTVMRETGARFLSVSTTHRCANSASSSCSGTTSACGAPGPYKVSDAAHNTNSFFYRFGVIVHDQSTGTHTIQLHGCGSSTCPSNFDDSDIVARLSAGTTLDLPQTETVNVLNARLNAELAPLQMGASLSCSEPVADKRLCGTTNTLGRYINGQADSCQNAANSFAGSRWLHIEQNANLRADEGAGDEVTPGTIARAINETF